MTCFIRRSASSHNPLGTLKECWVWGDEAGPYGNEEHRAAPDEQCVRSFPLQQFLRA